MVYLWISDVSQAQAHTVLGLNFRKSWIICLDFRDIGKPTTPMLAFRSGNKRNSKESDLRNMLDAKKYPSGTISSFWAVWAE